MQRYKKRAYLEKARMGRGPRTWNEKPDPEGKAGATRAPAGRTGTPSPMGTPKPGGSRPN